MIIPQDDFSYVSWAMMSKLEITTCRLSFGDIFFALFVKGHVDVLIMILDQDEIFL
jgi:hypothetical protein